MDNVNKNNLQEGNQENKNPTQWNEESVVVNEQDQNRTVNTGDADYKENVTGRTTEETPRDLNLNTNAETKTSEDFPGGAEIETPHRHEGDDEESTERKIPKM